MTHRTFALVFVSALVIVGGGKNAFAGGSPSHGMVVSADSLASSVGIEVLKRGGNAVDAAVAVGFALAVTYPEAGNIGGGGYMVIRKADGKETMIDFREQAPRRSSGAMFLDSAGQILPGRSVRGGLSSGVPGTVAGLLHALRRYGSMKRYDVLRRPIELAQRGIPVNRHLAETLKETAPDLLPYSSTMKVFSHDGSLWVAGDTLRQRDLAKTLRAVARLGSKGFYRGAVADMITRTVRKSGGIMSHTDLLKYKAVEHHPVRGVYRGYEIISASPSSAGGTIVLEILNMLEQFDLKQCGQNSPTVLHLFASAAQRAYADRAEYLGDPAFTSIPTGVLTSKSYATRRGDGIDSLRRTPSSAIRAGQAGDEVEHQTTHYCVIDSAGSAVSVTITLNELFGNKIIVEGAGFFLNNEMDDFALKSGAANIYGLTGGDANGVRPGKRMLSTMTPTIVLKNGRPFLLLGGRGGSRIATSVAQVLMNVIDFGMGITDAVAAPRIHHQWTPDILYYERGIPREAIAQLDSLGYKCELVESGIAEIQAIELDPVSNSLVGGPDQREGGVALEYPASHP